MDCLTLVEKIQNLRPDADLPTIARLCLLIHDDWANQGVSNGTTKARQPSDDVDVFTDGETGGDCSTAVTKGRGVESIDTALQRSLNQAQLRLNAATDQRAAVAEELQELAESDPRQFQQEQIWVLVRAIKVLSHTAHLYAGDEELDI